MAAAVDPVAALVDSNFDLASNATLLRVKITTWSAKAKCVEAAANAASAGNADSSLLEATIRHVAKAELQEIESIVSEARNFYASETQSWDEGIRLVTNVQYQRVVDKFDELKIRFKSAVANFIAKLPNLEKLAAKQQGKYAGGFPSHDQIEAKFRFDVESMAISRTDDIRLRHVSPAAAQKIEADTKRHQAEAVVSCTKKLVERIHSTLQHLVDNLAKGQSGKWQESTITNIIELGKLVPELNLTNDPAIAFAARNMVEQFRDLEPKKLKTDATERDAVAAKATSIIEAMNKISDKI